MGGNRLDFSVILMSTCLFEIIREGFNLQVLSQERGAFHCLLKKEKKEFWNILNMIYSNYVQFNQAH